MAEDNNSEKDVVASKEGDAEGQEQKYKYPYSVFFIISNEFCERFNYYGMRTILAIYLTRKLDFSDDIATIIYHSFTTLVYFMCIIGAIIADSWWGKFNTIVWLSIVYVCGSVTITLGSIEPWNMPAMALTFIGLSLIAIGSGGIKPCVAAFGGEQFKMPEQAMQLARFFSMFYFSINLGSFISTLVTPILREDIKCFSPDMEECYPYGFGLPAILMAVSIVIFLAGKRLYKILPNQGNMIVKVTRCISNAVSVKGKEKKTNPRGHWLEYAEPAFGKKLVMETKILLNVLVLYIPLPIFWALFDQQGSRWTFQATRMDGDLGWYTIKPDQMQVINPLLILAFIPLYEVIFYPLLNLVGIRRPLQKITLGGIFAGLAFLCSMFIEIIIEPTYPNLPKAGESQFRIFNGHDCAYNFGIGLNVSNFNLLPGEHRTEYINFSEESLPITFSGTPLTSSTPSCGVISHTGTLESGKANSFFLTMSGGSSVIEPYDDNPDKSRQGRPVVRVLTNINSNQKIELSKKDNLYDFPDRNLTDVVAGSYEILIANVTEKTDIDLKLGGVYTIVIVQKSSGGFVIESSIVTEPNSVNMLWLIPQYVIMTLGEVMYSVTGLQFSYTQAPESMKSVLQGCWLLTVAVGNLIVTIIVGAKFFDSQVYEFLLFACLMFVDMAIFTWLGIRYKPIPLDEVKKAEEEDLMLKDEKKSHPLDN